MDGTENQEDTLQTEQPGQPSPEDTQGTSTEQAKTYTEEELNKAIEKAKNDALAQAGREAKKLSEWEANLKTQQTEIDDTKAEITRLQEQIDKAELEAARGDPDKLKEYQRKKSYKDQLADLENAKKELRKQQETFEREKAEHAETVKAAREVTLGMKLYEIAARHNLNPEDLKKDMKDFNLTTEAQVEALAKRLSATGQRPPGGESEGEKKPSAPVSVPTIGGRRDDSSIRFDANAPSARDMISKGLKKK